MALFQNTVISKYLKTQNPEVLSEKWNLFTSHFHDSAIQENIRNSKEEQYQEGFLRDLFVKVLGYTLNPNPDFNLTTEYKNVKDAKKADGAVIIDDNVPAVIELKGTDTTDLGTVEDQAFGYKNNQPTCKYVIISNFEKLRFYIDNAIEHIEFNLFKLTEDEFKLLYLCLAYENIKNDIASKIKNESLSREDEITKQLYKDYSVFKRELFQNLIEENPEYNQVELFKKSQKLLDRLLFLFFGEDRGLLPPNSVRMILDQWNKLKDLDEYVPLYDRFKKYFGYLNTGFKGKQYDVFAYNGGLFEPDEILDNTKIDDNLLYTHSLKLSDYDFESEVDVNILGHIFEHSLNEIDEIKAQLEGEEIDKTKTKRKKDGVFYTPKYITKYIVENTVGKLCEEEKTNLGIKEEDYYTDKKRQLKTKQILLKKLQDYRTWLHQITIIDPACGSGSFLIEALNFLIEEHSHIDEMEAKLTDSAIAFSYHPESILEHNLYGVDINEESVEIAKLSLWLRTAEPNRKLSSLNDNLKCGNSLIDDPEVAGKLAFNWEKEFPKIFKEKNAYHLVFTTHNSRISERMKKLNIIPGKPANLSLPQEIKLAEIFGKIIKDYDFEVLAWNVCKDHVHLILVCTEDEIFDQVRIMKSISSKELNRWMNSDQPSHTDTDTDTPMGLDPFARHQDALENHSDTSEGREDALNDPKAYHPEEHNNHLWSQKFFSVDTKSWRWISDQENGFPYRATHLSNALTYIETNRYKHELPISSELEEIIASFVKTPEEVFKNRYKGGFDVVIGNPPYVLMQPSNTSENVLNYFKSYQVASYKIDLFHLFFEKSILVLKNHGKLGFITPNTYLNNKYIKPLRHFILQNTSIKNVVNYKDPIFPDAGVDVATIILSKEFQIENEIKTFEFENSKLKFLGWKIQDDWIQDAEKIFNLNKSLNFKLNDCVALKDICTSYFGIQAYDRKSSISYEKENQNFLPIIDGGDIKEFSCSIPNKFFDFRPEKIKSGGDFKIYNERRIVISQIGFTPIVGICDSGILASNTLYNINLFDQSYNLNYLLSILTSKLLKNYWISKFSDGKKLFPKIKGFQLKELPIKRANKETQQPFIEIADQMLSLNKELQELSNKFQRMLEREFELESLSKKLQDWYNLSFAEFLKEFEKQKIKLSLTQKSEWEDYFTKEQIKALSIQSEINATDKEIDQMVYQLYGLTEEEIEVVERG